MKKGKLLLKILVIIFIIGYPLLTSSQSISKTKRAFMWFDAEANFQRFSYPDSIDFYLNKIKQLGFTDVVVDVRPISGEVLFTTKYAPRMREWRHFVRPDFDYLGRFIATSHRLGMRVHASLNIFSAGHNYFDRGAHLFRASGMGFDGIHTTGIKINYGTKREIFRNGQSRQQGVSQVHRQSLV